MGIMTIFRAACRLVCLGQRPLVQVASLTDGFAGPKFINLQKSVRPLVSKTWPLPDYHSTSHPLSFLTVWNSIQMCPDVFGYILLALKNINPVCGLEGRRKKRKGSARNGQLRQKAFFYFHWTLWLFEIAVLPRGYFRALSDTVISKHFSQCSEKQKKSSLRRLYRQ